MAGHDANRVGGKLLRFSVGLLSAAAVIGGVAYFIQSYLPYLSRHSALHSDNEPKIAVVEHPGAGPWGRGELIRMAAKVVPADVTEEDIMPPPQELVRESGLAAEEPIDQGVRVVTGFEGSVPLKVNKVSDSHFALRIATEGLRNWFMFRVEGVPTGGKLVRIDLDGVNLGKWRSLNPVYSYCTSLGDLSAFGASPGKSAPVRARNGPLLPDTSGQQWHYMPNVWTEGTSRLCFVHRFDHDAYVAMRVPYTPTYNDAFLASLKGNPHVAVITLGRSPGGHLLQLVKISAREEAEQLNPCVFLYAREHADEQDSSWAVEGALRFLISDDPDAARLREHFTFLLLPIYDPDGAAAGLYERISYSFAPHNTPAEVLAYANWFEQWVDSGKRLDMVLDLHNMESKEMDHLTCYFADERRMAASRDMWSDVIACFSAGDDNPYTVSKTIGPGAALSVRLGGWLSRTYDPVSLLCEMNSQESERHLSMPEVEDIGHRLVLASATYLSSEHATSILAEIGSFREGRQEMLKRRGPGADAFQTAIRLDWHPAAAANDGRELIPSPRSARQRR